MGARDEARAWAETVQAVAADRDLVYEPVGGINPVGGPVALCPGGTNRITGQLADGFWGASCDADEREEGGLFSKAVLPGAVLAKSHVPDLAKVMPPFNVESIERRARRAGDATRLAPQGRVREHGLQQALPGDGAAASTTRSPCARCSAPRSSSG